MKLMKVILVLGMVALTFNLNAIESEQSVRATLSELCGEKSCKTIFKKLRKYARNGSPHAQSVLAMMYLGGIGVDQDLEAGYKYMRKSAKNGLAFAQYHLAIMYRDGVVTDKDEEESLKWLTKSASSGYRQAKALLNGEGKSTVNPEDFEGEHLVVTAESPTLTDFMEYLRALGYGKDGQTGSRIKGQGCANSAFSCLTWDVNTGGGRKNFDNMLSRLHSYNTALEMKRLGNTK
ncbi:sel1 repeat family protein [Aliikangiella marina]|uniref:Sel1 repeat family protein n=1 Tax=Aliikangiella marina TaxID=1712262 RepID=A0A545T561_9GAMM|nr:tetratricopeptide repeat protein [Aliikangiella marina]TQV72364.1 sel1 repeat family protein [Aliikangiella marina]